MDFTENLSQFFIAGELAEAATVAGTALLAIFEDGYEETDEIEGTGPQLACQSVELPEATAQGSTVVVGGKTYTVTGVRPDGTGITVLDLEYVSG